MLSTYTHTSGPHIPSTFCANGGQRLATVLCYLNDVTDGGHTAFRRVKAFGSELRSGRSIMLYGLRIIKVQPRKGTAASSSFRVG